MIAIGMLALVVGTTTLDAGPVTQEDPRRTTAMPVVDVELWLDVVRGDPVPDEPVALQVGETVVNAVRVRNRSSHTVRLEEGPKNCGCLAVRIAEAELAPGAETDISLSAAATADRGLQDLFVRIVVTALDGPAAPRTQMFTVGVRYKVPFEYRIEPPLLSVHAPRGSRWRTMVALIPLEGEGRIVVDGVSSTLPGCSFEVRESWRSPLRRDEGHELPTLVEIVGVADGESGSATLGYVELEVRSASLPRVAVPILVRTVPVFFGEPNGAVVRLSADSLHPIDIAIRSDFENTFDSKAWRLRVDGADELGFAPALTFEPADGFEGRWGRISGHLGARPAGVRWEGSELQLDSFDVVLESADGAELLRLPIVVWSGGTAPMRDRVRN